MIELLKEYIKILERINSAYPISFEDMNKLKKRREELYTILHKKFANYDDFLNQEIEDFATRLRDMHSERQHVSKLIEECGELISACAEYMFATEGDSIYELSTDGEIELKHHIDKERLDVLNTLTTFKGFGTMSKEEEIEFRKKQMMKHL